MNFVEGANDEDVLFLLATGQTPGDEILTVREDGPAFRLEFSTKAYVAVQAAKHVAGVIVPAYIRRQKEKRELGMSATAISSLAQTLGMKINKSKIDQLSKKCTNEKGESKQICLKMIRKDAIRAEILALNSMKVKCRSLKNDEACIKNIDKRIKMLQQKKDAIKVS